MVTSNSMAKHLPCQIVARYILGKVAKFGGSILLMKKVKSPNSVRVKVALGIKIPATSRLGPK